MRRKALIPKMVIQAILIDPQLQGITGQGYAFGWPKYTQGDFIAGRNFTPAEVRESRAVVVLSSADPVRSFQDFATLDGISGGRAELMVGRGSFIESFPLFGYSLDEVVGKHHRMFCDPGYSETAEYAEFWRMLGRGSPSSVQYALVSRYRSIA